MNIYEPVMYTPTYNDAIALAKSAAKCKELGWKRIVIDGRYHGFEKINNSNVSTDDTEEICRQYGFDYMICSPCYEEQKFNFALQVLASQGHKIMALLSSDEWLEVAFKRIAITWLENLCRDCEYPMMFNIVYVENQPDDKYVQNVNRLPKFFYNLNKIENRYTHWSTYIKGTNKMLPSFSVDVPSVILHHDSHMRPEERDDMMLAFQDGNVKREAKSRFPISRDRTYG